MRLRNHPDYCVVHLPTGGGGGGVLERHQISYIRPPKKSNIRYQTPQKIKYQISRFRKKSDIWLKKSDIRPKNNQLSDITPPTKSNIKISPVPPPPPYCISPAKRQKTPSLYHGTHYYNVTDLLHLGFTNITD